MIFIYARPPHPAEEHTRQRADIHALSAQIRDRLDRDRIRIETCLAAVAGRPAALSTSGRCA